MRLQSAHATGSYEYWREQYSWNLRRARLYLGKANEALAANRTVSYDVAMNDYHIFFNEARRIFTEHLGGIL